MSVAILSNTLYVLFVLAAGVTVMDHGTLHNRHALKDIAPRLVIGIIASNASLWLICQAASLEACPSGPWGQAEHLRPLGPAGRYYGAHAGHQYRGWRQTGEDARFVGHLQSVRDIGEDVDVADAARSCARRGDEFT